ncbi:hypothetical protein E5335_07525 [Coriobacteriaceae bacterium]|uniref:Uncharacterized protein n=1 Tax=Granulimonas faecalis TaxID=2894155 RepID=A0AAV5B624_9ACTN|nr:hypothetical protein [Granulimonas faecalis]TGY58735.1 hypothetical protein E5335_07525 [Coriobacteriaceae bacterium]GJM56207.1 hypothetical protein ATOP_18620 [Granulimonas faecalis]
MSDEELADDGLMYIAAPGVDKVPLDGSEHITTIDDPQVCEFYGPWDCPQVPAVIVPEDTVRGGDRLHVTVELVRGGDDG